MKKVINTSETRLGVDLGGVIIPWRKDAHQQQSPYGDQPFLLRSPYPYALERLQQLVAVFAGKVWIISRCAKQHTQTTLAWINQNHVFEVTGIRRDHLCLCQEIPDKATICAELGITHFIDDRVEVMEILRSVVPYLYLFGGKARDHNSREGMVYVADWNEACIAVISDLKIHPKDEFY